MFILFGPQTKVCCEFWPQVQLSLTAVLHSMEDMPGDRLLHPESRAEMSTCSQWAGSAATWFWWCKCLLLTRVLTCSVVVLWLDTFNAFRFNHLCKIRFINTILLVINGTYVFIHSCRVLVKTCENEAVESWLLALMLWCRRLYTLVMFLKSWAKHLSRIA